MPSAISELPQILGRVVLGIETSCDETAVALVADDRTILAERLATQEALHAPYGGVVPEIAARAHVLRLDGLVAGALGDAGLLLPDVTAVGVTTGPGLVGGLAVGLATAKVLAAVHGLPLVAVNHLAAHALTARLTHGLAGPYLLLLVSGGHSQIVVVAGPGRYRRLGTTIDDAAGEAFDKVAKLLGLGHPGGPALERLAMTGDPGRHALPRPLLDRPGLDLSFSGLKTAVRLLAGPDPYSLGEQARADIAASFQAAVGDVLAQRCGRALDQTAGAAGALPLVVAGGVAANAYLRARLAAVARERGTILVAPPVRLCSDNGAMVAWAAIEALADGAPGAPADLTVGVRARWPLDEAAAPRLGSGRKGAKA